MLVGQSLIAHIKNIRHPIDEVVNAAPADSPHHPDRSVEIYPSLSYIIRAFNI